MLHLQVPSTTSSKRPSFLQRSASVASLIAWKERFESYSGKFIKQPTFVSYANEDDPRQKLSNETYYGPQQYNYGPENDLPPEYPAVVTENPPPPFPGEGEENQKTVNFTQDFTALESYLKKKLCVKKKPGSCVPDAELETAKVFQWMHELPEGDNLEEFLEAYGIPTKDVDMGDLKGKLKGFLGERLAGIDDINVQNEHHKYDGADTTMPYWKRQIANLEDLAYDDNLEKWLESLDVPYFRPIPETKNAIRKYLNLPDEANQVPVPKPPAHDSILIPMPDNKEMEAFVPKWKELVEKMGALKNEEDLDKWLESLEVPHNVQKAKIQAEIRKFFRHETYDNFLGKSIIFKEHHIAKTLWDKFEDSSTLKQVGMIAGTTAVLGLIAVLSTTLLSFAVPAAFAVNPFFTEIFSQYFLQRQEVAFNLLNFHATQAKPLSTAWAKQFVLWKYC